jgi:hypothetical protein
MPAIDYKKTEKYLYQPKTTPEIVDVPQMTYIAVDGTGDPNTSKAYAEAIEVLYGLTYTIKMDNKDKLEYVVLPLEGFWTLPEAELDSGQEASVITSLNKDSFIWTAVIRQPDFVTETVFEQAKETLSKKKPQLDLTRARLETLTEGLCVQVMHIGPFDDEPLTIAGLYAYVSDNGYSIDLSETRRHHEIYLSDFRKTAPEKLKTVIRYPIRA